MNLFCFVFLALTVAAAEEATKRTKKRGVIGEGVIFDNAHGLSIGGLVDLGSEVHDGLENYPTNFGSYGGFFNNHLGAYPYNQGFNLLTPSSYQLPTAYVSDLPLPIYNPPAIVSVPNSVPARVGIIEAKPAPIIATAAPPAQIPQNQRVGSGSLGYVNLGNGKFAVGSGSLGYSGAAQVISSAPVKTIANYAATAAPISGATYQSGTGLGDNSYLHYDGIFSGSNQGLYGNPGLQNIELGTAGFVTANQEYSGLSQLSSKGY